MSSEEQSDSSIEPHDAARSEESDADRDAAADEETGADRDAVADGESGADRDAEVDGTDGIDRHAVAEWEAAVQHEARQGPPRWLVFGGAALAIAGFVVAATFGIMWWVASNDDNVQLATTRDQVVTAARESVIAFTELDHRNPDAYFQRQREVSTGDLRKGVDQSEKDQRELIKQVKTTVTSTVQDVGVEQLNAHEGKAEALVMVKTDVAQGQDSATKVLRLQVELTRVDSDGGQEWKLSAIGDVPVAGAGQ